MRSAIGLAVVILVLTLAVGRPDGLTPAGASAPNQAGQDQSGQGLAGQGVLGSTDGSATAPPTPDRPGGSSPDLPAAEETDTPLASPTNGKSTTTGTALPDDGTSEPAAAGSDPAQRAADRERDEALGRGTLGQGPVLTPAGAPSGATWRSGVSGTGATNGSFAAWRGEKVTITGTWHDTSWKTQAGQWSLDTTHKKWKGDLDIAIGAFFDPGDSWSKAANGTYDARWRTAVRKIRQARAGSTGNTYLRFAHEMNGTWYPWSVNQGETAQFKQGWARFATIVRKEYPRARIVFCANGDSVGTSVTDLWPGNAYVDVVGVDFYDMWPSLTTDAIWDKQFHSWRQGGPRGLGAWRLFAERHGKPLAVPEWGLDWSDTGSPEDNPVFISRMNGFFRYNAGTGPGKVLYEIYLNRDLRAATGHQVYPVKRNPRAAAKYRALSWGR